MDIFKSPNRNLENFTGMCCWSRHPAFYCFKMLLLFIWYFLTCLMLNLTCCFPSSVAFSELLFEDEIWTDAVNGLWLESERKMLLANIFPQWPPVGFSLSSSFISADPAVRRNSASTSILSCQGLKHETSALSVEREAWPEQFHH